MGSAGRFERQRIGMRLQDGGALRPAVGRGQARLRRERARAHAPSAAPARSPADRRWRRPPPPASAASDVSPAGHSTALSAGWPSPNTTAWTTPVSLRSDCSTHSGETLRPKAVISTCFLRPCTCRKPSASMRPRSPVGHQAGGGSALAQVAGHQAAGDLDLAVRGHPHPRMRQRAPRAAGPVGAGQVECLHRGAFGQAVTFVCRNAQRGGLPRSAARPRPRRPPRPCAGWPARSGRSAAASRPRRAASAAAG